MYVFEVSNLTMNEHHEDQYLIKPISNVPTHEIIHYPIKMPRLDRIWVSKDISTYVVEKVLPYVDVWGGQEEYDRYTDIKKDTIYRIWENGEIATLWYNRIEYGTGNAPALVGDASLFISEDNVLISDILGTDIHAIVTQYNIGPIVDATQENINNNNITNV